MPICKGSPITPIPNSINPIPRTDTYFFKIHSNIVLPSTPRPSYRSLSYKLEKLEIKSVTYSSQGIHTCQLDFSNSLTYGSTTG